MRPKKIICLGDSNTYGYDPRSFFGDSYDFPWPEQLAQKLGAEVINLGENGAEIPHRERDYYWLKKKLTQAGEIDLLIIMLGSNDLLNLQGQDTVRIADRMKELLHCLKQMLPDTGLLLLAPPPLSGPEAKLNDACIELTEQYWQLAEQENILFADPKEWDLTIAGDGVHLTEEAHSQFAEEMAELIKKWDDTPVTKRRKIYASRNAGKIQTGDFKGKDCRDVSCDSGNLQSCKDH